jgi:hypothetical protein
MKDNNILYRRTTACRLDSLTTAQVLGVLAMFAACYLIGAFITIIF